ncbi:MAG: hypothetical protein QG650_763 [Patescibacteria group bacterium]|nr:hypothetical protein [Patescibacteria group bacterium]
MNFQRFHGSSWRRFAHRIKRNGTSERVGGGNSPRKRNRNSFGPFDQNALTANRGVRFRSSGHPKPFRKCHEPNKRCWDSGSIRFLSPHNHGYELLGIPKYREARLLDGLFFFRFFVRNCRLDAFLNLCVGFRGEFPYFQRKNFQRRKIFQNLPDGKFGSRGIARATQSEDRTEPFEKRTAHAIRRRRREIPVRTRKFQIRGVFESRHGQHAFLDTGERTYSKTLRGDDSRPVIRGGRPGNFHGNVRIRKEICSALFFRRMEKIPQPTSVGQNGGRIGRRPVEPRYWGQVRKRTVIVKAK